MTSQIKVGDKAPDFTLLDVDTKPISLNEFLGQKVVLSFVVGAFTTTCTKESCEFRDSMARLVDLKAQVLGIDITAPISSKRFADRNRLPFPVLSDSKREVLQRYGLDFKPCNDTECCWGSGCYPIARRSIIIIDENGFVRYVWVSNNSNIEPSYEELQKILDQIT
jgi:glutaredoxin-dependent peroxiredoxin